MTDTTIEPRLIDYRTPRNPHGLRFIEGEDGGGGESNQEPATQEPARLPDDHPLVTAYGRQKAEIEALRTKAARLDEIEQANRTDAEKAAEELAEARAEVEKIPATVADHLRGHLVRLHKISDEDAGLYLTGDTPDVLLKQVDRYVELAGKKVGVVPTQGTADPNGTGASSYELGRERGLARYQKQN